MFSNNALAIYNQRLSMIQSQAFARSQTPGQLYTHEPFNNNSVED